MKEQRETKAFEWPVVKTDFFPLNMVYSSHIWSGYYTSRPYLKKQIRDFTGITQATDTFFSFQDLKRKKFKLGIAPMDKEEQQFIKQNLKMMNEYTATLMHHDTITATSPRAIIKNYTATIYKKEIANSK